MSDYHRHYISGGIYFFTAVTHKRQPILTSALGRRSLRRAIRQVRETQPFHRIAVVLLPDHLHWIWELPESDHNYSTRWRRLKDAFSKIYRSGGGREGERTRTQINRGERAIWQRRFWEHTCRDEDDLARCVDYIHWNPVKHGLVECVKDYPWSSFHRYVRSGDYDEDGGHSDPSPQSPHYHRE